MTPVSSALFPLVGFVVALIAAPAGISGAFLLLPFQVSVLGLTSPAVTATNLLFNAIATPGGLIVYGRERRIDATLARFITLGTFPGVIIGAILRVTVFRTSTAFKEVIGLVLVAMAVKLVVDVAAGLLHRSRKLPEAQLSHRNAVFVVAVAVGVIGGVYGIGGGSILAPFLVGVMGLSVYRVAGAALLATLVTSLAGIVTFSLMAALNVAGAQAPNWGAGFLFGLGGFAGSYVGARLQRQLPELSIKALLGVLAGAVGAEYIVQGLRK
jgi:uncharacterized protein